MVVAKDQIEATITLSSNDIYHLVERKLFEHHFLYLRVLLTYAVLRGIEKRSSQKRHWD
jgi:hypothetical protein